MKNSLDLFDDYLKIDSLGRIKLVIMGKDPYPTNPCYIPFCKPSWKEQLSDKHCGVDVLKSIGVDVDSVTMLLDSPVDLFLLLRQQGIVFLNLSYQYIGVKITKIRNISNIIDAHEINKNILNRADNIILCGEAKKLRWVRELASRSYYCVVHPDHRNRINPNRSDMWKMWWDKNSIAEIFKLDLKHIHHMC